MRFILHLERCFNKCHAEARTRGKVFESPYEKEVAEARYSAIDYIYAFMGSAIDHTYPLEGGYLNCLPKEMRNCFQVFWREYQERGYTLGLMSAAHNLNLPVSKLTMILAQIDEEMKSLAHNEVRDIMKTKRDVEIKMAMHFFQQKVERYKKLRNLA